MFIYFNIGGLPSWREVDRCPNGKTNRDCQLQLGGNCFESPSYIRTNMYLEKFILGTKITNIFHKYANFA